MLTSLTPPSCGELEALSLDARRKRILADAKLGRMLGEAIGSNGLEPGLITIDDLACAIIDLLPVLISKIAAPGENSMTTPVAPSPERRYMLWRQHPLDALLGRLRLGDLAISVAMEQRPDRRAPGALPKDRLAAQRLFGDVCNRAWPQLWKALAAGYQDTLRVSIEDRIQETLIYAYKKFWSDDAEERFDGRASLEGFLITLAKYEVRGHLKHHGKRPTQHLSSTDAIDLALADDPPISDSQLAETIRIMLRGRELMPGAFQPQPGVLGDLLGRHGESDALEAALEPLKDVERRFARCYHIQRMANKEISEQFGCTPPYVTKVLRTAWYHMSQSRVLLDALNRIERGGGPPRHDGSDRTTMGTNQFNSPPHAGSRQYPPRDSGRRPSSADSTDLLDVLMTLTALREGSLSLGQVSDEDLSRWIEALGHDGIVEILRAEEGLFDVRSKDPTVDCPSWASSDLGTFRRYLADLGWRSMHPFRPYPGEEDQRPDTDFGSDGGGSDPIPGPLAGTSQSQEKDHRSPGNTRGCHGPLSPVGEVVDDTASEGFGAHTWMDRTVLPLRQVPRHRRIPRPTVVRLRKWVRSAIDRLGDRALLSTGTEDAYFVLDARAVKNQEEGFVYQNADSGFNRGFPSGFFADNPATLAKIRVNTAAIDDPSSPDGIIAQPVRSGRRRHRRRLVHSTLIEWPERRVVLSSVSWINPNGGDWDTASNWSSDTVPTAADDVTISIAVSNPITHDAGTADAVNSVTSDDPIVLSAGSLSIAAASTFSDTVTLSGGTLSGGPISTNGATLVGTYNGSGGTLAGVTLDGTLDLATNNQANVTVTGGLTLNGTIDLGNNFWGTTRGQLRFVGAQTLGGSGSVLFGGNGNESDQITTATSNGDSGTLTIGSGITIHGKYGVIGNSSLPLINQGTIAADISGGQIVINGTNWTNSGTLHASNGGELYFQGTWTNPEPITVNAGEVVLTGTWTDTAPITAIGSNGGLEGTANLGGSSSVYFEGTLDHAGTTLSLNDASLTYILQGGTVSTGSSSGPGIDPAGPKKGNDVINTFDFLEAQTFTTIALAGLPRYRDQIDRRKPIEHEIATFAGTVEATTGGQTRNDQGYSLVALPTVTSTDLTPADGIAWEFTSQVDVVMRLVDELYGETTFEAQADNFLAQVHQAQQFARFGDDAGLVAATLIGENDRRPARGGFAPVDQPLSTPFQGIPEHVGLAAGPRLEPPPFPEPGDTFEIFQLASLLGKGGTSRVFLARDLSLGGKQVVLRVSLDGGQEPKAQEALEHPHIVPVNSVALDDRQLRGLSMPFQPGLPLDEVIKRVDPASKPRRALSLWQALAEGTKVLSTASAHENGWDGFPMRGTYAEGVAWIVMTLPQALDDAHGMRTYHRDVKPGNVLLTLQHGPQLLDCYSTDDDALIYVDAVAGISPEPSLVGTVVIDESANPVLEIVFQLGQDGLLSLYETFFLGINQSISTTDSPTNDQIQKIVYKPDVNRPPVSVSSSRPISTYGQSITFTATVSPTGGGPTPPGTVQFVVDGSSLGSPIILVNGAATSTAISKPVPKVIDFGTAKVIDFTAKAIGQRLTERTLHTRHGATVGTPEYTSPEQAENGALDVDTRTDVYALGVLLYELLTGTTPPEWRNPVAGAHTVMVGHSDVNAGISIQAAGKASPTVALDHLTYVIYTPGGMPYGSDIYAVISGVAPSTTTVAAAAAGTHIITAAGTAGNFVIMDFNSTTTVSKTPLTVSSIVANNQVGERSSTSAPPANPAEALISLCIRKAIFLLQKGGRRLSEQDREDIVQEVHLELCKLLGPDYMPRIAEVISIHARETPERRTIEKALAMAVGRSIRNRWRSTKRKQRDYGDGKIAGTDATTRAFRKKRRAYPPTPFRRPRRRRKVDPAQQGRRPNRGIRQPRPSSGFRVQPGASAERRQSSRIGRA